MTATDNETKIVEKLLALKELSDIGDIALLDLTHHARLEKFPAGTILRADGYAGRRLYLVDGSVSISVDDKPVQAIEAGSDRALLPLFRVRTHGLIGRCQSTVEILSVDETVFERYVKIIQPDSSGIEVSEYLRTTDEPGVVTEANLDFTHAEVDLPSMPDTAMRIYQVLQDPEADLKRVADTIKLDPIIAVRLIQVANSAMYRVGQPVESIKDAIMRIGINATRAVVISVVLKNLFTPQSTVIHRQLQNFYKHSIRVGAIAFTLAKHLKGFDPDEALLAGLIHDIGVVPILIEADHNKALLDDEGNLTNILTHQSHEIGANLLRQWGFEEVFITVAEHADDWQREIEQADFCDLIQIAQLHCAIIGGKTMTSPAISEIPAFRRLGMDSIDPQTIIKDAKHEIHEIIDILSPV